MSEISDQLMRLAAEQNPEHIFIKKEFDDLIWDVFDTLDEREQNLFALRFGLFGDPKTSLAATARLTPAIDPRYNSISRERARQIEMRARRKMQYALRTKNIGIYLT